MNEPINDGGPAFPLFRERDISNEGMSLRDYFAAAVLTGYMSLEDNRTCPEERLPELEKWQVEVAGTDAQYCYRMADAMIAQRRKP